MKRSSVLRLSVGLALAAPALAAAPACGSRGPLDDTPIDAGAAAADVAVADVEAEAAPDATPDAPVDAGREAGILACGGCLVQECSEDIRKCVESPSCRATFQCVLTDCLAGGGLDPQCLVGCAAGDPSGAIRIFQIFQCVTETCGPECGPLLSGLLGGLGGGGGGGGGGAGPGPGPGGKQDAGGKKNAAFAKAFSAWPELVSPVLDAPE